MEGRVKRLLLLVSLTGCGGPDTSLYRIDCASVDCPSANVEYITDGDRYRCWWACRNDVQLDYFFELKGKCWRYSGMRERRCDDDPGCGWDCLAERLCDWADAC
jgi:hypothetical protein